MPHLGCATFLIRSSVMPPRIPSSSTPARCRIPQTFLTSRNAPSRSSLQSTCLASTTAQRARSPSSLLDPARRSSTSWSGWSPCSLMSQETTAFPRPPVAPVRSSFPSSPLAVSRRTRAALALPSPIRSKRGTKGMPQRPASCSHRSVSSLYARHNLESSGTCSSICWKHSNGRKKRCIFSEESSMDAALLAPATMAPVAPAGQTTTSRALTPDSRRCCTNCTKRQLRVTSSCWLWKAPAVGRAAAIICPPDFAVSTAFCRSPSAIEAAVSLTRIVIEDPVDASAAAGACCHRTAYSGSCSGLALRLLLLALEPASSIAGEKPGTEAFPGAAKD
mmetsp:Transcript_65104/g.153215  ORF Transcript_65104/g.153215 Transcript_65104/m.153215 type:complete len:334 (-) Transcript_65104:1232-2233(-)